MPVWCRSTHTMHIYVTLNESIRVIAWLLTKHTPLLHAPASCPFYPASPHLQKVQCFIHETLHQSSQSESCPTRNSAGNLKPSPKRLRSRKPLQHLSTCGILTTPISSALQSTFPHVVYNHQAASEMTEDWF